MIPMAEFAARPVSRDDRDVLVRIIIRKDGRKAAYTTQRNSQTDFPLIACCVSRLGDHWYVAVGARPGKAKVTQVTDDGNESLADLAKEAADASTTEAITEEAASTATSLPGFTCAG